MLQSSNTATHTIRSDVDIRGTHRAWSLSCDYHSIENSCYASATAYSSMGDFSRMRCACVSIACIFLCRPTRFLTTEHRDPRSIALTRLHIYQLYYVSVLT
jgi:hypothetical protein